MTTAAASEWTIVDLPPRTKVKPQEWEVVDLPPKAKPGASAGMFDDLIPGRTSSKPSMFDDLIAEAAASSKEPTAPDDVADRGVFAGIVSDVRNALGYEQTPEEITQRAKAKAAYDEERGAGGWTDTLFSKDGARLAAQGVTLGAADEIEAGVRSLGNETYAEALESVRSELAAAREKPGSLAIEMGSGVLVPGGVAARGLAQAPSWTRGLWGTAWRGAGLGGAAGFAGSEGSAESDATVADHLAERTEGAAWGAGLGGALGATLPAVGAAARGVGGIVKARLGIGDDAYARQALADALRAEATATGRTACAVVDELEQAGLPLALSGTQSLNQLSHNAAEHSPLARRQLIDLVADAEGGAGRRVERAIDDAMGHDTAAGAQHMLQEARRANAARAYGDLFEQNTVHDMSDAVDTSRPTMRAAVTRANRWLADVGGLEINDPTAMTPRQIDYVARALDDSVDRAFRSGSGEHGARLAEQRDAFLRAAHRQLPGYRETRAMYREDSDALRALEAGRAVNLKDGARTEGFVRSLDGMQPFERRQARTGALQTLRDEVRNGPQATHVIRSVADSPARADNLREIVTPRGDEYAPELSEQTRHALEELPGLIDREARSVAGAQALRQGMPDYEGGLRGLLQGVDPASVATQPQASITRTLARYALDPMNERRAALVSALLRDQDWARSVAVARAQLARRGTTLGEWTTRTNASFGAAYTHAAGLRPAE